MHPGAGYEDTIMGIAVTPDGICLRIVIVNMIEVAGRKMADGRVWRG